MLPPMDVEGFKSIVWTPHMVKLMLAVLQQEDEIFDMAAKGYTIFRFNPDEHEDYKGRKVRIGDNLHVGGGKFLRVVRVLLKPHMFALREPRWSDWLVMWFVRWRDSDR